MSNWQSSSALPCTLGSKVASWIFSTYIHTVLIRSFDNAAYLAQDYLSWTVSKSYLSFSRAHHPITRLASILRSNSWNVSRSLHISGYSIQPSPILPTIASKNFNKANAKCDKMCIILSQTILFKCQIWLKPWTWRLAKLYNQMYILWYPSLSSLDPPYIDFLNRKRMPPKFSPTPPPPHPKMPLEYWSDWGQNQMTSKKSTLQTFLDIPKKGHTLENPMCCGDGCTWLFESTCIFSCKKTNHSGFRHEGFVEKPNTSTPFKL